MRAQPKWIPLFGNFTSQGDAITFHGGPLPPNPSHTGPAFEVGNLLSDRYFGGGKIEATVTFSSPTERSACGLMLYYQPATQSFIEAQLGGFAVASLNTFANGQWTPHGSVGRSGQLEVERPYKLRVNALGSRVSMFVDDVEVLTTNLPFPLPRGQAGIWCTSDSTIQIKGFGVAADRPKAFVVMQFTAPYNELYSDVIKPVCEAAGFQAQRADETYGPGLIVADIERQIIESQVVVADITPANPNVYYEVGYAHALRKPTILIAETPTKLPFDVSPFRTLFYENSIAGKARVEAGLRKHIEAIAAAAGIAPGATEAKSLTNE
jgi:hypothetical protein